MKKLLIILFLIPIFALSQSDTSYNSEGKITTINQKEINRLVSKYKRILKNTGGIEGWRIQIKFKSKREDILPYQIRFTNLYPNIPAQIIFDSPYYKLTVGNFRTRNEALKVQNEISKRFAGSHPVPCVINPNLLKK